MSVARTTDTQSVNNNDLLSRSIDGTADKATVGKGLNAFSTEAPPPPLEEALKGALASLNAFISGGPAVDVEVLLVQVAVAMRDTEAGSQKAKITTDQQTKKAQLKHKEAKLKEAQDKLDKAEEKRKHASLIDKIKLAFEWIGAALAVAVAVVMIATGVGAVVGGLLIAAAVATVVMAIDSTVSSTTGMGIAGHIAEAAGASPEEIRKADMGFKISLAVIGVALSVAAGGASILSATRAAASAGMNAANAAGEAGATTAKMVQAAVKAARQAFMTTLRESSATLTQGAKMSQRIVYGAEAVTAAGSGATDISSSVIRHEETVLRADSKELAAEAKADEAIMQMLDDLIDQALARLMASGDRFNAILDSITDAVKDRSDSISRARFAG